MHICCLICSSLLERQARCIAGCDSMLNMMQCQLYCLLYCQALVKYLDNVSDEDIPSLEIPTGVPLIYELDENLKPIRHYYVG